MGTVLSNEILLWIKLTLCIANSQQNLDSHEEILNSIMKTCFTVRLFATYRQFFQFYYPIEQWFLFDL